MERVYFNARWHTAPAQSNLMGPTKKILLTTPPLRSKSNKPLAMTTDDILNILVYYHLNEFSSGRELLQNLEEDEYGVDSEFGKNRTFKKNKCKHYRLFLIQRSVHYEFKKVEHITYCFF